MRNCAVIYARVSTKEQGEEGYSIPAQIALLEDYAQKYHFEVIETFSDEETASKTGRTEYKRMLALLANNGKSKNRNSCRTILVEKTDRLYRNFRDYVDLDELDIEIHLVKEGEVLSKESKSHVKFIHGIKVLMAKNYSDNLSEEVSKGMTEKAREGHWPSSAPIGYINNTDTRLIEPDPLRAPLIKKAFRWYASGTLSLQEVCERLTDEGLRSKRKNMPFTKYMLEAVLKNPIFFGVFIWKGKEYKGQHEPLITKELFDKTQNLLDRKGRPKKNKREFIFRGLITCGHCGCMVTGMKVHGKYTYYHCTGYKGKCPEKYIREQDLEKQFTSIIQSIEIQPWLSEWIKECLESSHQEEIEYHREQIKTLTTEYNKTQNRIDMMYMDKLDGKITEEYWESKNKEFRSEQWNIQEKLATHQTADTKYKESGIAILKLAKMAYGMYLKQNQVEKRRLLNILLLKSYLKEGKITAELRKPFDMLRDINTDEANKKAPNPVELSTSKKWRTRRDLKLGC